ncbi:MAG: DJ-1/PfpI family protein [Verrucomicrobiia bacterium]
MKNIIRLLVLTLLGFAPIASAETPQKPAAREKVLIIIGDATETVDTLYPYYRLIEGGYEPVVAGPEKRRFQMVLHEVKPGWTITKEWEGYTLEANIAFKDIKPEEYLGIFFSGGRAPEYIRDNPDLIRITRYFFEKNKPIASVCHGVEIPARAGCVKGRRMATVPKCQFDLEVCGGIFVNAPCVVDGNLVSGRTFHDHGQYMGKWMKLLDEARDAKKKK